MRMFEHSSALEECLDLPHCYKGIVLLPCHGSFAIPVLRRNKKLDFPFDLPGGKGRIGETPEQALIREIEEELDIIVRPKDNLATIPHPYRDDQQMTFMACEYLSGRAINKDRIDHAGLDICAPQEVIRRFGNRLPDPVKEYIGALPPLIPSQGILSLRNP